MMYRSESETAVGTICQQLGDLIFTQGQIQNDIKVLKKQVG